MESVKIKLVRILVIVLVNCLIIFALFVITGNLIKPPNHFNRSFAVRPVSLCKKLDIEYNSYYIAGISGGQIYLGNETAPFFVLKADTALADSAHVLIKGSGVSGIRAGLLSITSSGFYLTDRKTGSVCCGDICRWEIEKTIHLKTSPNRLVALSPSSFAIRTFAADPLRFVLVKQGGDTGRLQYAYGVLENQLDGLFSNDGMLSYNPTRALLVYVYFYRNQYICMDTNLNVLYRGKSIDSNSTAKLKVSYSQSGHSSALSGPPVPVNRNSCLYGNSLYIISALKADNEPAGQFNRNDVVDKYDLRTGKYEYSSYIPRYQGQKIKSFRIYDNRLIAVSDHYLLVYQMENENR